MVFGRSSGFYLRNLLFQSFFDDVTFLLCLAIREKILDLSGVIKELVEERGLERELVIAIVCEGVRAAYEKKYPDQTFYVNVLGEGAGIDVSIEKTVVTSSPQIDTEITARKARVFNPSVQEGDLVMVPFDGTIGRIEVLVARQAIAQGIMRLEQKVIYDEFKEREGTLITGTIHKSERAGFVINLGTVMAFLPKSCSIPEENLRVGFSIRAVLKEVLEMTQGGYQLILDRASPVFVRCLFEAEIPEVFEGIVEIKQIERIAGYKSKILVAASGKDIDPVGACVGVGGARIKPILKELVTEKIDLITWTDDLEKLAKDALKPAAIDKVQIVAGGIVNIWLPDDQRSFAIGKMGQNIALASRLTGLEIVLQESSNAPRDRLFGEGEDDSKTSDEDEGNE